MSDDDKSVSRRDFLRRAGREAVKTGSQATPLNLVKAAAGISGKTPWWKRVAAWRDDKTQTTEETKETNESADAE
jgi:hypothetical protein